MNNPKSNIENRKSKKAQARTLKLRRGFTLVEILIAATLSLVLIGLVVQVFATVGATATQTRSVVQMTDRLRSARIVMAQDLANVTADMTKVPLKKELNQGYLEYIEGPDGAMFPGQSGLPVAFDINQTDSSALGHPLDSTVGDPDDILMFTANAPNGTYFYGHMRASSSVVDSTGNIWTVPVDTMAQASSAEICYFLRGNTLYRRVLLIMPATNWPSGQIDPTIFLWSLYPTFVGKGTTGLSQPIWDISFYDKFDLSARQVGGSYDITNSIGATKSPVLVPNTLGDLTLRQNRYGHQQWVYPFDARFWDERNWINTATNLPGGFLGLPTLRECTAYTGTLPGGTAQGTPPAGTSGNNGVARWPFPLFELNPNSALPLSPLQLPNINPLTPPTTVTVSGNANIASGYLWGQPLWYHNTMTVPALVQTPIFPYYNPLLDNGANQVTGLPLIYPYPTSPPLGTTAANFQPVKTVPPNTWTGRINLSNTVNGGLFDMWSNPYPLDQQDYTAAPRTGALYAFSSAFQPNNEVNINFSGRYADDVLLTHVLSFDVKAWDPTAPTIQTTTATTDPVSGATIPAGTYLPGDPGYVQIVSSWAASGLSTLQTNFQPMKMTPAQPTGPYGGYGNVVAQGAYVDLNYLGPVIQPFLASNTQIAQALATVSNFAGPGAAQFGADFSLGSGLGMLYDTGCFDYENDGIDQNQNGIIDDFTNGLDDNGLGGVDDLTEVEGAMPYPAPLKGIQIKIRVYEPDSRQIREVTLTQDFL